MLSWTCSPTGSKSALRPKNTYGCKLMVLMLAVRLVHCDAKLMVGKYGTVAYFTFVTARQRLLHWLLCALGFLRMRNCESCGCMRFAEKVGSRPAAHSCVRRTFVNMILIARGRLFVSVMVPYLRYLTTQHICYRSLYKHGHPAPPQQQNSHWVCLCEVLHSSYNCVVG